MNTVNGHFGAHTICVPFQYVRGDNSISVQECTQAFGHLLLLLSLADFMDSKTTQIGAVGT